MSQPEVSKQECLRCGNCCHVDMIAYVTPSDISRWEEEGRDDILERLRGKDIVWSGDIIVSSDGKRLKSCIFLNRDDDVFFCEVYTTRPGVCRAYEPGPSTLCPLHYKYGS